MKYKMLVIFLFALIISCLIFKITYDSKVNYLALGDDIALGKNPFNDYSKSYVDFFITYLKNQNKLKNYNTEFLNKDIRISDVINDIKNNKIISNKNISQCIKEANVITISLGFNELLYKIKYNTKLDKDINDYIEGLYNDYVELIKYIRNINDPKIYIIGFYNYGNTKETKELIAYINNIFSDLEENKKIYFVNIENGFNNKKYYLPNIRNPFPSIEGQNYISNKLIEEYNSH